VINVRETLLSPRVRNILSLKERQVVGNTVNLIAQLIYELHRIVARPRVNLLLSRHCAPKPRCQIRAVAFTVPFTGFASSPPGIGRKF